MNDEDLESYKSVMKSGDYRLDGTRFARLKQSHGVLFPLTGAKHYLYQLKVHNSNLGNLECEGEG